MNVNGLPLAKKLSKTQVLMLSYIYQLRSLSFTQICDLFFSSQNTCRVRLSEMINKYKVLERIKTSTDSYYFLTTYGISVLKETGVFSIGSKELVKNELIKASELKMKDHFILHQTNLNQFVLDFQSLNLPLSWRYYDEKFVRNIFKEVRPDGVLKVEDTYFFLEMDMNTETEKQLRLKWEHYRAFFKSQEYLELSGDIYILFIVAGTSIPENRIEKVKNCIYDGIGDLVSARIDFLVNIPEKLINTLSSVLMSKYLVGNISTISDFFESQNFVVKESPKINKVPFSYYIKALDENNNLIKFNDTYLEFLVDDYSFRPCSCVLKTFSFTTLSSYFYKKHQRPIHFIIVGETEEDIIRDYKNISDKDLIHFTTVSRLLLAPLNKALFTFDSQFNLYHYSSMDLKVLSFEKNLGYLQKKM